MKPGSCGEGSTDLLQLAGKAPGLHCRLEPGSELTFSADLQADQAVSVGIQQLGVDVELLVKGPGGEEMRRWDRPSGGRGLERVTIVPIRLGRHTLLVKNLDATAGDIRFDYVDLEDPAGEGPGLRAAAEREYLAGLSGDSSAVWTSRAARLEKAAELFRKAGDAHGEGIALAALGERRYVHQAYKDAEDPLRRAEPLLRVTSEAGTEAEVHNTLGMLADRKGDLAEALERFEKAEQLGLDGVNDPARITSGMGRARVMFQRGELQTSLDLLAEQLHRAREIARDDLQASVLLRLAEVYSDVGASDRALRYAQRAAQQIEGLRNQDRRGEAELIMGRAYLHLRELPEAESRANHARELFEAANQPVNAATALFDLGQVQSFDRRHAEAAAAFKTASEIYREQGMRVDEGRARLHHAWALERGGDPDAALAIYPELLKLFVALGQPESEASAHYGIARAQLAKGRLREALDHVEKAIVWVESRRLDLTSANLGARYLARKYDYYRLKVEILMRFEERRPGTGHAAAALAATELGRARALLDSLSMIRQGLASQIDAEFAERWRELQGGMIEIEAALGSRAGPDLNGNASILHAKLQRLNEQLDGLEVALGTRDPRYAALIERPSFDLERFQDEFLDPQTRILVFFLGERRSWLWSLDQKRLRTYELPPQAELETAVRLLVPPDSTQAPTATQRERMERFLADLSHKLFASAPEVLDAARLVIVPDGALHLVPFAALPAPRGAQGEGQPLVAHREIVRLPSLAVLAELRRMGDERAPPETVLGLIGDPVFEAEDSRFPRGARPVSRTNGKATVGMDRELAEFAADLGVAAFGRLPNAERELAAIRDLAGSQRIWEATGFDANLNRIKELSGRSFRYLHVVTHGFATARPELSGLVLSQYDQQGNHIPGFFRLSDVYEMALPVDTVVLSACRTAAGEEIPGEGIVSLTRGFFYAGALRVVTSLWNVDDESSAALMEHLYEALLVDGLSPGAALRQAQNSVRSNPQWSSPYFWAGFVVQGDWR